MPDTPTTPSTPTVRIIPGAPPPAPISKSQKKKHKAKAAAMKKTESEQSAAEGEIHVAIPDAHAAALIETAPSVDDVKEGSVADQLVAHTEPTTPAPNVTTPLPEGSEGVKQSHLVDMLSKRFKATSKKITRIQSYSTTPPEKLNEDQRRTLKTLPILEGVLKELDEVKKAVETYEAEVATELAIQKARVFAEQEQQIKNAVATAEAAHLQKILDLLSIFQLHTALTSGSPAVQVLNLLENEGMAIYSAVDALIGPDSESKASVVEGLLTSEGEWQGVSYSRLQEITNLFLHPPPAPTPPPVETVEFTAHEVPEETEPAVGGLPPSIGAPSVSTGAFRFMQEDELALLDEQAEETPLEEIPVEVAIEETITEVNVNGHTTVEESVTVTTTTEVPQDGAEANVAGLRWSDEDDGGLPSIASLHDKFGSSATGTPAAQTELLPTANSEVHVQPLAQEDDGFQAATRGRGGRGRGGFRGERGAYRGFRGGERGSYRGRGERGSFRGGERGGYRGGRGEWRGDGERGRGRGRGRGGFDGARGGAVPAPAPTGA